MIRALFLSLFFFTLQGDWLSEGIAHFHDGASWEQLQNHTREKIKEPVFLSRFDEAMHFREREKYYLKDDDLFLTKVRHNFDKFALEKTACLEEPRIPKIIHQIWLGSPFPEECKALQASWKKHHPDWEYRLWTEKEIAEFGLENRVLFEIATNYGEKADIARYEILNRIGGVYMDADFECLKPFDWIHHCCDFYAGVEACKGDVCNAIIASKPHHPLIEKCVKGLMESCTKHNMTVKKTGPLFLTRCLRESFIEYEGPAVLFPVTYFYPWSYNAEKGPKLLSYIKEETQAIHYWHAGWMKQKPKAKDFSEVIAAYVLLGEEDQELIYSLESLLDWGFRSFLFVSKQEPVAARQFLEERGITPIVKVANFEYESEGLNQALGLTSDAKYLLRARYDERLQGLGAVTLEDAAVYDLKETPLFVKLGAGVVFEGALNPQPVGAKRESLPKEVSSESIAFRWGLEPVVKKCQRELALLEKAPKTCHNQLELAIREESLGEKGAALKRYRHCLELEGDKFAPSMHLASLTLSMDDYLAACRLSPDRFEPFQKVADICFYNNCPKLGVLFAKLAVDNLKTELWAPLHLLGINAWYVGQHELGKEALNRLLKKHPNNDYLKQCLKCYN